MGRRRPYSTPEADAGWADHENETGQPPTDEQGVPLDEAVGRHGMRYNENGPTTMINADGVVVDIQTGKPV